VKAEERVLRCVATLVLTKDSMQVMVVDGGAEKHAALAPGDTLDLFSNGTHVVTVKFIGEPRVDLASRIDPYDVQRDEEFEGLHDDGISCCDSDLRLLGL
jgi:hypothetical protein